MKTLDPRLVTHLVCVDWLLNEKCPVPLPDLQGLQELRAAQENVSKRYQTALRKDAIPVVSASVKRMLQTWKAYAINKPNGDVAVLFAELLAAMDFAIEEIKKGQQERTSKQKAVSKEGAQRLQELRGLSDAIARCDAELERIIGLELAYESARRGDDMASSLLFQ